MDANAPSGLGAVVVGAFLSLMGVAQYRGYNVPLALGGTIALLARAG